MDCAVDAAEIDLVVVVRDGDRGDLVFVVEGLCAPLPTQVPKLRVRWEGVEKVTISLKR